MILEFEAMRNLAQYRILGIVDVDRPGCLTQQWVLVTSKMKARAAAVLCVIASQYFARILRISNSWRLCDVFSTGVC